MGRKLWLAAVTIPLIVAGCGSSGSSPKAQPSPTPLTAEQAKALAAAGVLTSADLPGYAAEPQTHDASDEADERAERTCMGLPAAHYLARNFGTSFTRADLEIDSSADVAASASEAAGELRALSSDKGRDCLKAGAQQALGPGITVKSATVSHVPVSVAGSDEAFGYRLSLVATSGGETHRLSGYEVGSLVGAVEIDVSTFSEGGTTMSLADVISLTAKATSRVRAAL